MELIDKPAMLSVQSTERRRKPNNKALENIATPFHMP
jgi:hypothetical protein